MKKAILLPMLCLITLCGCEKSTELSEITGNTGNSENPETETPENGSLTFQLHTDKTTCNLLDLTVFSISFNRTVSMLDISNQFDSIAWIVEDKDKNLHSFRIMEQNKKFSNGVTAFIILASTKHTSQDIKTKKKPSEVIHSTCKSLQKTF